MSHTISHYDTIINRPGYSFDRVMYVVGERKGSSYWFTPGAYATFVFRDLDTKKWFIVRDVLGDGKHYNTFDGPHESFQEAIVTVAMQAWLIIPGL